MVKIRMAKKRTTKRKTTRKSTSTKRKTTRKSTSTKRKIKKPFGGYAISFKGREETMEQVFGKANITPSEMTKKLWKFIKSKRLSNK